MVLLDILSQPYKFIVKIHSQGTMFNILHTFLMVYIPLKMYELNIQKFDIAYRFDISKCIFLKNICREACLKVSI